MNSNGQVSDDVYWSLAVPRLQIMDFMVASLHEERLLGLEPVRMVVAQFLCCFSKVARKTCLGAVDNELQGTYSTTSKPPKRETDEDWPPRPTSPS